MPEETLRLLPGVDQNRTAALNEAGISTCQLIRQVLDRQGQALVQKLGGWARYFGSAMPSIPRALWAWKDLDRIGHVAVGCETSSTPGVGASLITIDDGSFNDITPLVRTDDVAVDVTTVAASSAVVFGDAGSDISRFVSVFVPAHISVGGIVVFGFYQCIALDANTFQINLIDRFGNPVYAVTSVPNGGAVASFHTTAGNTLVQVTLADHGYAVGDIYPVLISTVVGGITLVGEYEVQGVSSSSVFTILSAAEPLSTATVSINGGEARYNFYLGFGPLPAGTGFGIGAYGAGGFGSGVTPAPPDGDPIDTDSWTLDNFGQLLIAVPTGTTFGSPDGTTKVGGPIYVWSPSQNNPVAYPINRGPIASAGAFVAMPQQQVIAWGSTFTGVQDPLLLRWCDVGRLGTWTAQPDNQAGSYRIPRGSRIVQGLQGPQQGLILTDLALWSMQYKGPTGVYGFNEIAAGCGLIGPKAAGVLGTDVFWMGPEQFFTLGGDGVALLYCPVWDVIFQNLDKDNVDKIRFCGNSLFTEVMWQFPSTSGGGEIDSYVKYNRLLGPQAGWDFGINTQMKRTAWIDKTAVGNPIGADTSGVLQQHEVSLNADGQPLVWSFQTGYFVLTNGSDELFIDQMWPDAKWGLYGGSQSATLNVTFYVKDYPADDPRTYGPYPINSMTKWLTPGGDAMGFRGRLVSILYEGQDADSFWRLGAMRYRYQADGRFYI